MASLDGIPGVLSIVEGEMRVSPDPIGHGSFGVVYRATWRGTTVAVKVLTDAGMLHLDAMRAELAAMARVTQHRHVVSLVGVGVYGGAAAIVTNFCARGSLKEALQRGDVPCARFVEIAAQAAAGVWHLHSERIVHRHVTAPRLSCGRASMRAAWARGRNAEFVQSILIALSSLRLL